MFSSFNVFLEQGFSLNWFKEKSFRLILFYLLNVNFKNLTVKLHVLYILNLYVKYCSNRVLFIIQSINLFLMHNYLPQKIEI